jgi:hypothetical protein
MTDLTEDQLQHIVDELRIARAGLWELVAELDTMDNDAARDLAQKCIHQVEQLERTLQPVLHALAARQDTGGGVEWLDAEDE